MLAPDFWDGKDALSRMAVAALSPAGALYGATVKWKARHAAPFQAGVPVVCVGNLTAGGTGKTPVAIAIGQALIARGRKPFFLTRGYGGQLAGPALVEGQDPGQTGDEALLLARVAPTIIARQRPDGARLAVERGADVVVMDDGHQNFTLAKDLSLVVIDAERGFGNGHVLPAGPLREPVCQGLVRANAVLLMGDGSPALHGYLGPVLRGRLQPLNAAIARQRLVAFAGIGRPSKFFATLRDLGADLVAAIPFPDHHRFTPQELAALRTRARDENAQLVTTEKDLVRLAEPDRAGIAALGVEAVISPAADLERLLDRVCAPR